MVSMEKPKSDQFWLWPTVPVVTQVVSQIDGPERLLTLTSLSDTHLFLEAAQQIDFELIEQVKDGMGRSLLHLAVTNDNLELVNFLCREVGCDLNLLDNSGTSPLHLAIALERMEIAKYLLQQPVIDCSPKKIRENSSLHLLMEVEMNHSMTTYTTLLRLAMDKGCSFYCQNEMGEYPLHLAAAKGQSWGLSFALQRFINPNVITKRWNTPLHYAIQTRHFKDAEILIQRGADRFIVNQDQQLPVDILNLLKDKSYAKQELKDFFINSPHIDILRKGKISLLLEELSLSTELREDSDGMTLLHYAIVLGKLSVVTKILENPNLMCYLTHKNLNGNQPLHLFARHRPAIKELPRYLTLLGRMTTLTPKPFRSNYRNETPLHLAVQTRNASAVKHFLEAGCPPNAPNLYGETPLHYAVITGDERLVQMLLIFGADRCVLSHRPNAQPELPVDIAIKTYQPSLFFLLHTASIPPLLDFEALATLGGRGLNAVPRALTNSSKATQTLPSSIPGIPSFGRLVNDSDAGFRSETAPFSLPYPQNSTLSDSPPRGTSLLSPPHLRKRTPGPFYAPSTSSSDTTSTSTSTSTLHRSRTRSTGNTRSSRPYPLFFHSPPMIFNPHPHLQPLYGSDPSPSTPSPPRSSSSSLRTSPSRSPCLSSPLSLDSSRSPSPLQPSPLNLDLPSSSTSPSSGVSSSSAPISTKKHSLSPPQQPLDPPHKGGSYHRKRRETKKRSDSKKSSRTFSLPSGFKRPSSKYSLGGSSSSASPPRTPDLNLVASPSGLPPPLACTSSPCSSCSSSDHTCTCTHHSDHSSQTFSASMVPSNFPDTSYESPFLLAFGNQLSQIEILRHGPSELTKDYQILELISKGPSGLVHRILERRNSCERILKILPHFPPLLFIVVDFFITISKITHPNIVHYRKVFEQEYFLCTVSDYCQVGNLSAVRGLISFSEPALGYISRSVLTGLKHLHDYDIPCLGLKPSNILVAGNGKIQLGNFGLSNPFSLTPLRSHQDVCALFKQLETFEPSLACRVPLFLAPEVLQGNSHGSRSDVWSFGLTMITLATTEYPFGIVKDPLEMIQRIMTNEPQIPPEGQWSDFFRGFVSSCCRKDVSQRPSIQSLLSHVFVSSGDKGGKEAMAECVKEYEKMLMQLDGSGMSEKPSSLNYFAQKKTGEEEREREDEKEEEVDGEYDEQTFGRFSNMSMFDTYKEKSMMTDLGSTMMTSSFARTQQHTLGGALARLGTSPTWDTATTTTFCPETWTIWVRLAEQDAVPVENVRPFSLIHDLKESIKFHQEFLFLQDYCLSQIGLVNSTGERLEASRSVNDCLGNSDTVNVILLG